MDGEELQQLCRTNIPLYTRAEEDGSGQDASSEGAETTKVDNEQNITETTQSPLMTIFGYLIGSIVGLSWAVSAGCSQALGGYVPAFELNLWRYAALFILVLPFLLYKKSNVITTKQQGCYLAIHCVSIVMTNLAYYEAYIYLPAGTLGGMEADGILVLICCCNNSSQQKMASRDCFSSVSFDYWHYPNAATRFHL